MSLTTDDRWMMEIRDRAMRLAKQYQAKGVDGMRLMLDLMKVHETVPLKLRELAETDDANFTHDVWGIMRHLNRKTGALEDGFFPRFATANSCEHDRVVDYSDTHRKCLTCGAILPKAEG